MQQMAWTVRHELSTNPQDLWDCAIFTYIYHKNQPNVGKFAIHGSYMGKKHPINSSNKNVLVDVMGVHDLSIHPLGSKKTEGSICVVGSSMRFGSYPPTQDAGSSPAG